MQDTAGFTRTQFATVTIEVRVAYIGDRVDVEAVRDDIRQQLGRNPLQERAPFRDPSTAAWWTYTTEVKTGA